MYIGIAISLVIIQIIHNLGVLAPESERNAPISVHGNRPVPLQGAAQGVKTPALTIHFKRIRGSIQSC